MTPEVAKLVGGRATTRLQVPSSVLFYILPHRKVWNKFWTSTLGCTVSLIYATFAFQLLSFTVSHVTCVGLSASVSVSQLETCFQILPDLEGSGVWEGKIMALDSADWQLVVSSQSWCAERKQSHSGEGHLEWGWATSTLTQGSSKCSRLSLKISWSACLKCRVLVLTSRFVHFQYSASRMLMHTKVWEHLPSRYRTLLWYMYRKVKKRAPFLCIASKFHVSTCGDRSRAGVRSDSSGFTHCHVYIGGVSQELLCVMGTVRHLK